MLAENVSPRHTREGEGALYVHIVVNHVGYIRFDFLGSLQLGESAEPRQLTTLFLFFFFLSQPRATPPRIHILQHTDRRWQTLRRRRRRRRRQWTRNTRPRRPRRRSPSGRSSRPPPRTTRAAAASARARRRSTGRSARATSSCPRKSTTASGRTQTRSATTTSSSKQALFPLPPRLQSISSRGGWWHLD